MWINFQNDATINLECTTRPPVAIRFHTLKKYNNKQGETFNNSIHEYTSIDKVWNIVKGLHTHSNRQTSGAVHNLDCTGPLAIGGRPGAPPANNTNKTTQAR